MSFDTNGCVQFSSGYKSDFHIELWSEARIPRTDDTDFSNVLRVEHANGTLAYWHWYFSTGANGGDYSFYTN